MLKSSLSDVIYSHDPDVRSIFGVTVRQSWAAMLVYEKLLEGHPNIDLVLEIGSACGGLSLYFAIWAWQQGKSFVTIDNNSKVLKSGGILRHLYKATDGSIEFIEADAHDPKLLGGILERRKQSVLVLCDGGDKAKELGLVAPLLQDGDILIGHDYEAEIFSKDIPAGFVTYEPWHSEAVEMNTRQLILHRGKGDPQSVPPFSVTRLLGLKAFIDLQKRRLDELYASVRQLRGQVVGQETAVIRSLSNLKQLGEEIVQLKQTRKPTK